MITSFTPNNACIFDLALLMRKHKVTIKELSKRMNVTMKAIRKIRSQQRVSYYVYCDYYQGVTGQNVFNINRYRAIEEQNRNFRSHHYQGV